ncbi:hypothetical protein [Aeromonas veronii]|uniref:hypothetical protein n=1 Tax=Aeromonas veronii TaxID=654 RepID=UPI003D1CC216
MKKEDWTFILLAVGIHATLSEEYKAATSALAGEYYTSADEEKAILLRRAQADLDKAALMFQQVSKTVSAELAKLEAPTA